MPERDTGGKPLRFGLVGTGFWATSTHAPVLSSTAGVELTGVWGRDAQAARALASEHGAAGFTDVGALLEAVDAVAFAVPPSVQCSIAVRAAKAGKHLLLEKPIATSLSDSDDLVHAVADARVSSVVFFTARFQLEVRHWLASIAAQGGWKGGGAIWLATALSEGNPFNTPWRREKGALWDLGPHAVSLFWAALGPVVAVSAEPGRGDLIHLVLHHEGGATSTATLTLGASEAAAGLDVLVWGDSGRLRLPTAASARPASAALQLAVTELVANVRAGRGAHECDVSFGGEIVRVLAQAEVQIGSRLRS